MGTTGNKVLAGSFLSIAALVVAGIAAYFCFATLLEAFERLDAQRKTLGDLSNAFAILQETEAGQRGYLLTGKSADLAPYESGRVRLSSALQDLRKDNRLTELEGDIDALKKLTEERMSDLEAGVQIAKEKGREAAVQLVATDVGKKLMDEIRAKVAGIERRQMQELDRAAKLARAQTTMVKRIILAGMGLAAIISLATAVAAANRSRPG